MTSAEVLVIRADGGLEMGTGHVMRGIALGQAWRESGGVALFAIAQATNGLSRRLEREGFDALPIDATPGGADDADRTLTLARARGACWIAVDGYHFDHAYQQALRRGGASLLLVDDYGHAERYDADLVLNQNLSASEALYAERSPHTRLLLGTRYALLRSEFRRVLGPAREVRPRARSLLVTLGGSDPRNVTGRVLDALAHPETGALSSVVVVVGGSNPHAADLERVARTLGDRVRIERDSERMPELMARADLAIAAGGTTAWEILASGLPALLMVLFDNQRAIAEALGEAGAAVLLGPPETLATEDLARALGELAASRARRAAMSRIGRELVDGQGAARVVAAMRSGDPARGGEGRDP